MVYRDVSLHDWILAAGWIAGMLAVVAALRFGARWLLRRARKRRAVLSLLLEIVAEIRVAFFVLPVVAIAAGALMLPSPRWFRIAAWLSLDLQFAVWIADLVTRAMRHYEARAGDSTAATTLRIWRAVAVGAVWIFAVIAALGIGGVDVRTLLTGLGVGGVAIALATQNVVSDLFASLSIVIDKPFVVGETIMVGSDIGVVERIGLKTTRVRSLGGEELIYSNGEMLKMCIRNMQRMDSRRVVTRLRADYRSNPQAIELVPALMRQAVESQTNVRFDRAHLAALTILGYEFELVYYVTSGDYVIFMNAQHAVLTAIDAAFREAGVMLAAVPQPQDAVA